MIAVGAIATAALIVAEARELPAPRAVAKIAASSAFVAQGIACGAGPALLAALVLSWVGDVCLLGRERRVFLAGLGAFLLAHVAFAAAFVGLGVRGTVVAAVAVPVVGAGWAVAARVRAGRLAGPVFAYATAIGAMVATAAGTGRPWVLAGAVLFWASDLTVARDRFVAPGWINRAVGLPLYYGAQLLLATVAAR